MLEQKTFTAPWMQSSLLEFVIVKAYEDKELEKKYGLGGYPTLAFLDSSGKLDYRCIGYKPPFDFAREFAKAFDALAIKQAAAIKS